MTATPKTLILRQNADAILSNLDVTGVIRVGSTPIDINSVNLVTKSANYTVLATESGANFLMTGVDKIFTLPATQLGLRFRFMLAAAGLSAGTGLQVAPAAVDKIMGNGFTSLDNKAAILAGASDREGDYIELTGDGVDGWYITDILGTWTRQA